MNKTITVAGDAYCSGVLYGAMKGDSLREAMKLGTAVAQASLRQADACSGVPTWEEALGMFHRYH